MKKKIVLLALILAGCQTTRVMEKIVISDTTRFVIIDTTHIKIVDTLQITNTINEVVFDTLYNFVDSVIVKELISSAGLGIRTFFHYDTSLILESNKLFVLRLHYDGDSLHLDYTLKQLIEGEIRRERVERAEVVDWFPSRWIQILIFVVLFLLIMFAVAWRFSKK